MEKSDLASIFQILEHRGASLSEVDRNKITEAYTIAQNAHAGQLRSSGEPYFTHVVATARNCAEFGFGADLVIAGLLHDTIEDTTVTAEEIEKVFGSDIKFLVTGVTKLGKIKYQGNERHVESLRKFFISVAQDVRVVIIKLADRLHNLQTLQYVRTDKQPRIAIESIEIYTQLASRLGMGRIASEIQDTAFPFAYPQAYHKTTSILESRKQHYSETLDRVYRGVVRDFASADIRAVKIEKRIKGLYSLYKKLERKNWNVDDVYDIIALRIIVHTVDDCYRVLGLVHAHYRPVPGRIKDYIAIPKPNGYQSLHTSVFAGDGNIAEIQIRTQEMHTFDEYGVASHHTYKQKQTTKKLNESFNWLEDLAHFESTGKAPSEYLKTLRTDFFQDRIFVYTPKGDVIDLPTGSTVIDFAFAVHSDIGRHASGAYINRKFQPLKAKLSDNDIIEVVTDKKSHPTSKWLSYCVSSQAQKHIRTYLQKTDKSLLRKIFG